MGTVNPLGRCELVCGRVAASIPQSLGNLKNAPSYAPDSIKIAIDVNNTVVWLNYMPHNTWTSKSALPVHVVRLGRLSSSCLIDQDPYLRCDGHSPIRLQLPPWLDEQGKVQ